ncbi:hypothetical protein M9H77_01395 [Catharanthus roseus]|uniref:Uncharacterized protein n=1 Tax=Catharanthus roseus TaxID=4058 RepID=A0ACC0C5D5_CATRO|nr:hypothetical protein M9H77_01395 [Catharanthus roseus]
MKNYEKINIMLFVDVDELFISDDSVLLECVEEEVTVIVETSIEDLLVGTVLLSKKDTFKLYNDHAFRLEFSAFKGNQKWVIQVYCVCSYIYLAIVVVDVSSSVRNHVYV